MLDNENLSQELDGEIVSSGVSNPGDEPSEVADRLREEINARHAKIAAHVEELRAMSEREILACGQVLSTIVDDARSVIDAAEAKLNETNAIAEKLTSGFMGEFGSAADEQSSAVDRMSDSAQSIEGAFDYVDSLRYTSEMLATNALIEAAHLGEEGRAFGEIALQLREQSRLVKTATGEVKEAVDSVRGGLSHVVEKSGSMRSHTDDYIASMQDFLTKRDRKDGSDNSMDNVIELSQKALSHLQFQDTLSQRLTQIDREMNELLENIDPIIAGEINQTHDDSIEAVPNDTPESGNIMLF